MKLSFLRRLFSRKAQDVTDFVRCLRKIEDGVKVQHHDSRPGPEVVVYVDFPPVYIRSDMYTGAVYFHYFTIALRVEHRGKSIFCDETVGDGFDELVPSVNSILINTACKTIKRVHEIEQRLKAGFSHVLVRICDPTGKERSVEEIVKICLDMFTTPEAMSSYVGMFRAMRERESSEQPITSA